jgi:hypothetical protein
VDALLEPRSLLLLLLLLLLGPVLLLLALSRLPGAPDVLP